MEVVQLLVPVFWQRLLLRIARVEDVLELVGLLQEVLVEAFEGCERDAHAMNLLVDIGPRVFIDPGCGVGRHFDVSSGPRE